MGILQASPEIPGVLKPHAERSRECLGTHWGRAALGRESCSHQGPSGFLSGVKCTNLGTFGYPERRELGHESEKPLVGSLGQGVP